MDNIKERENVLAGTVGAFLFALAGGVLWFLLYQVGFLASISGVVAVICALKGYSVFAKKESVKGIIISVISAVVVIVIAWYLCLSFDAYNAHKEWYANGEIDYTITIFEAIRGAYIFLADPEIARAYFVDLAIGLGLCILGGFSNVKNAIYRIKAAKEAVANPAPSAVEADFEEVIETPVEEIAEESADE